MVDDFLRALGEFKANMEYRNVDFNADKNKQYEAESQRKELVEKVKSEKALIKKSYSRVMEKIKELRQKFCNAVTTGSRSGSGKLVMEFYDVIVKIWGGSPSTEPLSFGVQSSVLHDHERQLGEENASDTSSDLSFQADQSPQGSKFLNDVIAPTMSRSFEMLAHALALPEQGMTQPSYTAVPFLSQPPRLHERHMGMLDDIMDLLNICLTSTYFQYNGKHYKQLHGTAMGSPVSVVIAEIVMQNIEERALSTCRQTIPLWLRYVDDTFTAVRHDEIDAFHNHLNEQNTDIQFTREVEENGKLPFLDCLVSHNDNSLRTTVYRKPTHTDRLLDESSYNPTSHKATTIRTLTRRAQLVCDSTDSLSDENKYLHRVFTKNNYNNDFIRRNTHRPTTTTETNDTATPTTTATIPYIKGMSENISRILLPFNIRVAHKPITTLRQLLTNVKDKDEPRNRQGTIYKINCSDCQASYIGETGRNLTTRLTEHRRATRKGDVSNHIAEHHRLTNHNIDWDSAQCLTYSTDYFQRLTLESWFTNLEQTPLNRCQQLPAPYKRLIHDINITNDRKRTT
ncbi:hypothetical protein AWC38_SpisGene22439 [Stylophora pistillata]|uniref:GIY-YIG domain-containing protein n=1 Tax=Stylophora pistillata TaxID=50429 RepID=A0A2B4RB73_STYPI|nr:hypothetical protein AWC38_SpisGene22439 [Stylophora pistillata]